MGKASGSAHRLPSLTVTAFVHSAVMANVKALKRAAAIRRRAERDLNGQAARLARDGPCSPKTRSRPLAGDDRPVPTQQRNATTHKN